MIVSISDAFLDSCFYSTNNGQTKIYFPCKSSEPDTLKITSSLSLNAWTIYAKDKAGWNSEKKVNFTVLPDAVEDLPEENPFKIYPNPVSDLSNIEFYLDKPEKIDFRIYDITGRELEKKLIEGNAGENRILHDFSEYKPAIYLYKFEGESRKKAGKIVKR